MGILKAIIAELVGLLAPVVTLFYRKGIWLTPDDPVSPFGQYEPAMVAIYARFGQFFGDWWWLGVRNRAYGLAYKWKPEQFKHLSTYARLPAPVTTQKGLVRTIEILGFKEYCLNLGIAHIIAGYRLRPVADEWLRCKAEGHEIPVRPFNMDCRPLISIRLGGQDD